MNGWQQYNCRCRLLAVLAAALAMLAVNAMGQATIVYGHFPITSPLDTNTPFYPYDSQGYRLVGWNPFPGVSYGLALNGQGVTNYTFVSSQAFSIEGSRTAGILALRTGTIFNDFWAVPLPQGYLIGADTGTYEWSQEHTLLTAARSSGLESDPTLTIGFFTGLDSGYAGLKFEIDGQTHYGWVRVGAPGIGLNGGWLYDYAYETRPNTPIRAGAKPVPVPLAAPHVVRPGQLRLTWPAEINKAYQIQCKENLSSLLWSNLNFTVIGAASNAAVDIPIAGTAKFFRVVEAD